MKFIMELLSPLCPAIGEGSAGIIDTEVAIDEYGIPEIPAKRLKGCLLECFDELAQYDPVTYSREARDRLFGRSGTQQGCLLIGNGHPSGYAELVPSLRQLQSDPSTAAYFHPDAVKEIYTTVRSQTAIDRVTGAAEPKSLRSMRVIQPGYTFEFEVAFAGASSPADLHILETCAKVLRHMGLNRTRGLGWVRCRLDRTVREDVEPSRSSLPEIDDHEVYELFLQLVLKSPVIVQEGYITGSTLLGSFASLYIRDRKKHHPDYDPGKDELFADLFVRGKVRFRHGYPALPEYPQRRSSPNSAHWKRKKDDRATLYIEESANGSDKNRAGNDALSNDRMAMAPRGFHIIDPEDPSAVYLVEPTTEIHYHHQRPALKSIGHALGPESELGGELFIYEALPRNSVLIAGLEGEGRYLRVLFELAARNRNLLRVGRSANAQYGQVLVQWGEWAKSEQPATIRVAHDKVFGVRLTSPAVVPNARGYCDGKPETLANAYLRELEKQIAGPLTIKPTDTAYCRFTEFSGYNAKWQLPKVTQPAYDGGSLFVFVNGGTEEVLLPAKGTLGLYTSVGYGEYEIDELAHNSLTVRKAESQNRDESHELLPLSGPTHALAVAVLQAALFRRLAAKASRDADAWFGRMAAGDDDDKLNASIRKIWKLYRDSRANHNYESLHNKVQQLGSKNNNSVALFKDWFQLDRIIAETDRLLQDLRLRQLPDWKPDRFAAFTCYYDAYFAQLKVRLKRAQKEGQQRDSVH